jgi:uncharacterized protein with beta-barrel porin domain
MVPAQALADCTSAAPGTGATVTCDSNPPNPFTAGVNAVPGSSNVTINVGTGAAVAVQNTVVLTATSVIDSSRITNGGTISVDGNAATGSNRGAAMIATGGGNTLTNNGTISTTGDFNDGLVSNGTGGNTLVNTGTITTTGQSAYGISATGNETITNTGTVTTSGITAHAVSVSGSDVTITNSGSLITTGGGGSSAAVVMQGTRDTLVNSGVIHATGGPDGVFSNTLGSSTATIRNLAGGQIISDNGSALRTLNGSTTIVNAGLLKSGTGIALDGGDGDITLTLQTGSRIVGAVNGGTGSNQVVLQGSGMVDNSFTNFQTLTMQGTDWTWNGSGAFANTVVDSGILRVNGSLISPVTVNSGGTLGGSGTVTGDTTINSGGTIQPGGTFTIIGTFTQGAGSTHAPSVNAAGQSTLINVTGPAVIQSGATVSVQTAPSLSGLGTRHTILTASGGVTGTYSGATSTLAFVTPSLSYDANDVFLTLQSAFAAGARTPNQRAVGLALEAAARGATGDLAAALNALLGVLAPQGAAVLDAISGQHYAHLGTLHAAIGTAFLDAIGAQLAASHGGPGRAAGLSLALACDVARDPEPSPFAAWLSGLGGGGSATGDGNAASFTYSFGGTALGFDYRFSPQFMLGFGAGYLHGTQSVGGLTGQGTADAVSGSLYASFTPGAFYLDASAGYAWLSQRVTRGIPIPGLDLTARGQTTANQFLGQIESGYKLALPTAAPLSLTPFVRLQGSTTTQAAFTETGAGGLNLAVSSLTTNSLRSTLGAEIGAALGRDRTIDVSFRLGWVHEYADTSRSMTAAFAGAPGSAFTVFGAAPRRDAAAVGLSLRSRVATAVDLYARYDGEVGNGTDNHAASAGLRVTW